jgi:hypothetical protein
MIAGMEALILTACPELGELCLQLLATARKFFLHLR